MDSVTVNRVSVDGGKCYPLYQPGFGMFSCESVCKQHVNHMI